MDPTTLTSSRVYVGNLAFSVGWQDLKDFFRNSLGAVGRVEIISYPSGRSKGCAVVEFDGVEEAGRAINELNNAEIHGRKVFIREDREGKGFASAGRKGAGQGGVGVDGGGEAVAAGGPGAGPEGWAGMMTSGGGGGGVGVGEQWVGPPPVYGQGQMGMMGGVPCMPFYAPPTLYQLTSLYYQQLMQHAAMQQHQPLLPSDTGPLPPPPPPPPPQLFFPLDPMAVQSPPSPHYPPMPTLFIPMYPPPPRPFYPLPHGPQPSLPLFSSPPLSPASFSSHSHSPSSASSTSSSPTPTLPSTPPIPSPTHTPSPTHLILSNLPPTYTWPQLMELCTLYGDVLWCQLVVDGGTGRSVGVGVVRYATVEQAEVAVEELGKVELDGGRRVEVRRGEDGMGVGGGGGGGG